MIGSFFLTLEMFMFKRFSLLLSLIVLSSLTGCAVVKATNQLTAKDLSVLNKNTPRATVIAEQGKPVMSEVKKGEQVDVFNFVQGYSQVAKTARALGHSVADVMTLGLWEVVGTPIEGVANGEVNQVEVHYNKKHRVSKVVALKGGGVAKKSA